MALDIAEEFRPLVADSTVLMLINNGEVAPKDFIRRAGAVSPFENDNAPIKIMRMVKPEIPRRRP